IKMKTKIYFATAVLAALTLFTACQKGDDGPAGPAGPAGKDGKTLVIDSPTAKATVFDTTFVVAKWETTGSSREYTYTVSIPALTNDGSGVEVFFKPNPAGSWYNLTWISANASYTMQFVTANSEVEIYSYDNVNTPGEEPNSHFCNCSLPIKIVIIPA